jgi:fructose-bisphosphate aldolase class II
MPLVTTHTLARLAEAGHYAIPALNVYNLETIACAVRMAEQLRAGIMIQLYERVFQNDGLGPQLSRIACAMADEASVPIAVTLDHGSCRDSVMRAVRAGCTGVMFDGSTLEFTENVRQTRDVVALCHACGVSVEGELGHVGAAARGEEDQPCTQTEHAARFVAETGVDLLAVMVGSAHGVYHKAPRLNIERIREIHEQAHIPVVLHGGSGIPDDQIRQAVQAGIRKINYATDINQAMIDAIAEQLRGKYDNAIDLFMQAPMRAVTAFMSDRTRLLGAADRIDPTCQSCG